MTTRYVDVGANLSHKSFRPDLEAVQERAVAAGVERIIVTGTSLRASASALAIAERSSPWCSPLPALFATKMLASHSADAGSLSSPLGELRGGLP